MKSLSIVIPSYNGKALLARNLPPLLRVVSGQSLPVEIIVVDDASSDGTCQLLKEEFPAVKVIVNRVNAGFGESVNRGAEAAVNEIVLMLNNDILVEEGLLDKALRWFDDPAVFSVTPNIIDPRRGESQAITRLRAGVCWFRTVNLQLHDLPDLAGEVPLFFGSGGASFYDRRKLMQLGGFDPVYRPFYVEDMDLSYRAWKSGWKCLLEPGTTVYHETSSTILNLHKKRKIKFIGDRNRTLFLWLNITDGRLILRYFFCLPFSLLYDVVAFRKYKFVGFFRALRYLPAVADGRRKRKGCFKMSDRNVIRIISSQ